MPVPLDQTNAAGTWGDWGVGTSNNLLQGFSRAEAAVRKPCSFRRLEFANALNSKARAS